MHLTVAQRIVGLLAMIFSLAMLPPLAVSLFYADGEHWNFAFSAAAILGIGTLIWLPVRRVRRDMRLRDGFLVVTSFWTVLGLLGALPLFLSERTPVGFTEAVFESVSGLTTTGSTVLTGLDALPHSILFYRQQLQWMGGMGIIVLAVAVLPMLGIGGMQLYRAEMPGPLKDTKLTPRISETAKALWYIYLGLTIACASAYFLAGMGTFDAIGHAFSTVAIGGFSTHDASIGYFESARIELIATVFMLFAGINFAIHFVAFRGVNPLVYFGDPESRAYVIWLLLLAMVVSAWLFFQGVFDSAGEALIKGLFQTVSIATTTGFTSAEFAAWPGFVPVLLLFASFVGACGGSTGGGIKVMRVMLLVKQGQREVMRLVHPHAQLPVKIGHRVIPPRVVEAVWGFFAAYIAVFGMIMLVLMATGLDQVTAFSAVAACLNNLGPGLGEVADNFGSINSTAHWALVAAMILGRLEIFTALVLLMPAFWRR